MPGDGTPWNEKSADQVRYRQAAERYFGIFHNMMSISFDDPAWHPRSKDEENSVVDPLAEIFGVCQSYRVVTGDDTSRGRGDIQHPEEPKRSDKSQDRKIYQQDHGTTGPRDRSGTSDPPAPEPRTEQTPNPAPDLEHQDNGQPASMRII